MKYDKLVRDKIPEIIESKGQVATWHLTSVEEKLPRLLAKLGEESTELEKEPGIDELVAVLQIVLALADQLGIDREDLFAHRRKKEAERGGFAKGIILDEVSD